MKEAIARKTGARGLRSIIENSMLDIMYELPSIENLKECILTEESIAGTQDPILVYHAPEEKKTKKAVGQSGTESQSKNKSGDQKGKEKGLS